MSNRRWWWDSVPEALPKHVPLTPQNDDVCSNRISFSGVVRAFASWLNRRRRRYLLLILFSPLLIPLIVAACPFICVVETWWFVRRKRRRQEVTGGGGDEIGLMQRYLEDQLMLVYGSMYGCGDGGGNGEEEEWVDVEYFDITGTVPQ